MLHIFYGTDTVSVRQSAFKVVAEAEANGASAVVIDNDTYEEGIIHDALGARSLFGGETVYLFDTPSGGKDFLQDCLDNLEAIGESANNFYVIEGTLLAADKKRWSKFASEMTEYKAEAGARFNTFALADALAQRDKKSLWLLLQEAKLAGQSAEEIIGILWWQLKSLRLAALTSGASEAGMKDYPYNKAKRSLSKFKDGEVIALSHSLLTIYHEGHSGQVDIDEGLEHWLLTI